MAELTCALVTPTRDDAENLRRLAATVLAQTVRPRAWVITDDGSSDDGAAVAGALAGEPRGIVPPRPPREPHARGGGGRRGRPLRAFRAGGGALPAAPDVVV